MTVHHGQPTAESTTAEPIEQTRYLATELPGPQAQALAARQSASVSSGVGGTVPTYAARSDRGIVEDVDGNRLIDLGAGIAVATVGASHPAVVKAVQEQVAAFTHTCFMVTPYESYVALSEKLNNLAPISGDLRTLLLNSGAEAVENAVKIARAATGKSAVVAFDHAYHGRTTLTMSLTAKSNPYKKTFGPFAPETYRVAGSYPYRDQLSGEEAAQRAIQQMEIQVGAQDLAAVIMEPIQGEGGFIEPAPGFLKTVIEWCRANGVLFIADEVQTGFARTGTMFACEHEGLEPDLITLAKGIAGGMPLSAVVGRTEYMNAVHTSGLGGTFGGNPVSCAAALAAIGVMEEDNLPQRAQEIGRIIWDALHSAQERDPRIGEVRGRGAMMAMEFVDPSTGEPDASLANAVGAAARAQGVITLNCGTYGNVIRLLPPLTISDDLLTEGLDVITQAIGDH